MDKKKTFAILLSIPFVIGLLSFVSIAVLTNTVAADILDISWNYRENEGFKVSDTPYRLEAEAIIDENLLLAPHSDELVWKVENIDGTDKEYATVFKEGTDSYLKALEEGTVRITCANARGTKAKHFLAHIYESGTIIVNRKRPGSGKNVDPTYYVGQFDLSYSRLAKGEGQRKPAEFEVETTLLGGESPILAEAQTHNVEIVDNRIKVLAPGEAKIEFYTSSAPFLSREFSFQVIENGYNVYNYSDLLMATNFSSDEKNVVLQVNLDSLSNTYVAASNESGAIRYTPKKLPNKENTELFGNFDFGEQRFSFEGEYQKIESTYNTLFIKQYNQANGSEATTKITAGIVLKGDLYGNGFVINGHDLCYPNHGKISATTGKMEPDPAKDHFFGPLAYVTIGSLQEMPVVKAYGQDNALIYLQKDGAVINDVELSNANQVDNMYNLMYTGTILEVASKNAELRNSLLLNGRTAVRAFSADGLLVKNCILKNAAEFLMKVGSNHAEPYDFGKVVSATYKGQEYRAPFGDFYDIKNPNSPYNLILNDILGRGKIVDPGEVKDTMRALEEVQAGLDSLAGIIEGEKVNFSDHIRIASSYFANSGIFSLAFESLFNGPFLYNGGPTAVKEATDAFSSLAPEKIGGTSLPVEVILDEKTRFYDWKDIAKIDSSVLIEENISATIKAMFGKDFNLSMEDYFPMKRLLTDRCEQKGLLYEQDGKRYVNSKVAWYGGGANLSSLRFAAPDIQPFDMSEPLPVAITEAVIQGKHTSAASDLIMLLAKCVSMATGVHEFRFITNDAVSSKPTDFLVDPKIEDLKTNFQKEENV